jgi:hypothetical protein
MLLRASPRDVLCEGWTHGRIEEKYSDGLAALVRRRGRRRGVKGEKPKVAMVTSRDGLAHSGMRGKEWTGGPARPMHPDAVEMAFCLRARESFARPCAAAPLFSVVKGFLPSKRYRGCGRAKGWRALWREETMPHRMRPTRQGRVSS